MITNTLKDITTEELEAEIAKRKQIPLKTTVQLLEERVGHYHIGELIGMLASCVEVIDYCFGRWEEDFGELFYDPIQLGNHAKNISILLGYDVSGEDIFPMD